MNHRNPTLLILNVLTAVVLATGIYTTGTQAVFADSTNLKQETKTKECKLLFSRRFG